MKRIYISSLFRVPDAEHAKSVEMGKLYSLDWDSKTFPTPTTDVSPGYVLYKPKSRSVGARGIAIYNNCIYVAGSYNMLSCYNLDTFECINTMTFPEFKGSHQIKTYDGVLYLASCANDLRHKVVGDVIVETEDLSAISDIVDPYIRNEPGWGNGRLHFNSIGWDSNGEEYHIYYSANMLFNYTRKEVVYQGGLLNWPHDIGFHDDNILVNSSGNRTTVSINKYTKEAEVIYEAPDSVDCITPHNSWGFTRALVVCGDYILIGSVPVKLTLLHYDGSSYNLVESFDVSIESDEAIYDMVLDQRDW